LLVGFVCGGFCLAGPATAGAPEKESRRLCFARLPLIGVKARNGHAGVARAAGRMASRTPIAAPGSWAASPARAAWPARKHPASRRNRSVRPTGSRGRPNTATAGPNRTGWAIGTPGAAELDLLLCMARLQRAVVHASAHVQRSVLRHSMRLHYQRGCQPECDVTHTVPTGGRPVPALWTQDFAAGTPAGPPHMTRPGSGPGQPVRVASY
jgi:hypothetical protein